MAYTEPVDPTAGTTITRAWAVTNVTNLIRWLRGLTGNADPPAVGHVARSTSTTLTAWYDLDGALAVRVPTATPLAATFADLITGIKSGFYEVNSTQTDGPTSGQAYYCYNIVETNQPNAYACQLAVNIANQNDIALRVMIAAVPGAWQKIWHAGNDGAGSGLDADFLDGQSSAFYATASSVAAINTVPSGAVVWFRTLAELTAAGAGWTRETTLDGRLPLGAGTTFSQTFAEATNYGANWTPASGLAVNAGNLATAASNTDVQSGGFGREGTGSIILVPNHSHPIPAGTVTGSPAITGTSTVWVPPTRAGIFGRRI